MRGPAQGASRWPDRNPATGTYDQTPTSARVSRTGVTLECTDVPVITVPVSGPCWMFPVCASIRVPVAGSVILAFHCLPTVTVPAGLADNGLPLGLQLSAAFMADESLLAWAEGLAEVLAQSLSKGPG